jgi:hypothetical protein
MTTGPELFARYAFPPNILGYCGPADSGLTEGLVSTEAERERAHIVKQFEGAWPYLELIGGLCGLDPLDIRVVEAYWIGNELLDRFDTLAWGNSVDERFRSRAGRTWSAVASGIEDGAPNHAFHVFCVYPWVGLLRSGYASHALEVIDRCRIRWGTVEACVGTDVVVRSMPLIWDGAVLTLGEPIVETVARSLGAATLRPGSDVSLHWDYVCDELNAGQLLRLQRQTSRHLAIVNGSRRDLAGVIEG